MPRCTKPTKATSSGFCQGWIHCQKKWPISLLKGKEPARAACTQPDSVSGTWEGFQNSRIPTKLSFMERQMLNELLSCQDDQEKDSASQLDILEVYAFPNSLLTIAAQELGLKANRFTKEDGDLSSPTGRKALLQMITTEKPKHVWLSPECGPWSPWNRFNSCRSIPGHQKVMMKQDEARRHLILS